MTRALLLASTRAEIAMQNAALAEKDASHALWINAAIIISLIAGLVAGYALHIFKSWAARVVEAAAKPDRMGLGTGRSLGVWLAKIICRILPW